MSSTLLTNELNHLIAEAKRKNAELRSAAEKSLQDLRGITVTSEQQLAADLNRRPAFVEPFLIACKTHNAKLAGSGVACLQRLIVSRALPKSRLQDALQAFNGCTDLGLDVQLKILQALPSLLQSYAEELKGDLLSLTLEVCSALQSAKVPTVSGVAAATLQQLVTSLFEKVVSEERHGAAIHALDQIDGPNGPISLKPAAFDAYKVFNDLVLTMQGRKTSSVQFKELSSEVTMELIRSCINVAPQLFTSRPELRGLIKANLLPLITHLLSEKQSFPLTVRAFRVLDLVLGQCLEQDPSDCILLLSLLTQTVETDAAPLWKRTLAMEVLRNLFAHGSYVIDAYAAYDMADGGKPVVLGIMSAFVRLSTEKPAVIGLGRQSIAPVLSPIKHLSDEATSIEASAGVAGIISSAFSTTETNTVGISSSWSIPRTSCLDQLDKSEPPSIPETYIYTIVLDCLGSLSESLAKAVLPLTVHQDKSRANAQSDPEDSNGHAVGAALNGSNGRARSRSSLQRMVPLNPLDLTGHSMHARIRAINALIEACWPAFLATSSTFLNAALDDQYYRNLIKAYQRFSQVAGIMRLSTARDALMTTLGKVAVPPHAINMAQSESMRSVPESPRVFSNPKGLLSVDSLTSQSTTAADRERQRSVDLTKPIVMARNLLCLRALLNIAIALGPTLGTAFAVIVDTLRQADLVLGAASYQQSMRQSSITAPTANEPESAAQALRNEVSAAEAAASRLLESTVNYPDAAFLGVLRAFCDLLHSPAANTISADPAQSPTTPKSFSRSFSGLISISNSNDVRVRDYKFALPRLRHLASLNVSRFAYGDPAETGWNLIIERLLTFTADISIPVEARLAATGVLCSVTAELVEEVTEDEDTIRVMIQRRSLEVLLRLADGLYRPDQKITNHDIDVQSHVLSAVQAILEHSGETLVAGWNRIFAILSSAFRRSGSQLKQPDDESLRIDWEKVSNKLMAPQLGRTAFRAAQLICSDFLAALPRDVLPALVELLYRFMTQADDLNTALSTVTMLWNVSDFLQDSVRPEDQDDVAEQAKRTGNLEATVRSDVATSVTSQWLLVLLRLQSALRYGHLEVRKAGLQTICSIFRSTGIRLTTSSWDLILRSVLFPIQANDVALYLDDSIDGSHQVKEAVPDETLSAAIIQGISDIMAQHLGAIQRVSGLASVWEGFLGRLESYLDAESDNINAAVYTALSKVLSGLNSETKVWAGPMHRTLALWLKRNPSTFDGSNHKSDEKALISYIEAGKELHRLTNQTASISQTRSFLENLYNTVRKADGPGYGADVNTLSPLQDRTLQLMRSIRSENPSTLIVVAAKLSSLARETAKQSGDRKGPTFVALASHAISWLRDLVLESLQHEDVIESGVLVRVLESLSLVIQPKYSFRLVPNDEPLWQRASAAAVELCGPILERYDEYGADHEMSISVLGKFVQIIEAVIGATGIELVTNDTEILDGETADLLSLRSLTNIIRPRLAQRSVPHGVLVSYTRGLFEASIVHPSKLSYSAESPLIGVAEIPRGRVKPVPFSKREKICYECFTELIRLSRSSAGVHLANALAQTAIPFLILRLSIPIRTYVADQPLRGRRPQPLSELEELLFCIEAIRKLQLKLLPVPGDASADDVTTDRIYMVNLYPLLIKAASTAADKWSGAEEVLHPLQSLLQSMSPGP